MTGKREQDTVTAPLVRLLTDLYPDKLEVRRRGASKVPTRGGYVYLGEPGDPDVEVIFGSHVMFIETKVPGGKLRPSQVAMHERMQRKGMRVRVARTPGEGVEHVREWMREVSGS